MRRVLLGALAALVLGGPTVLAFLIGGFDTGPRVWAGALSFACVIAALALRAPVPRSREAWLALGGLAALAALSLLSITWSAVAGDAFASSQIVVLYVGALLAATLVLGGEPRARRAAEPVLALGIAVVIGEGLAGRVLPGLVHLQSFVTAQGRLNQPLTYWNAMGELAAIGLVLCARLAGDASRPALVRVLAAAAGAPLGAGLYMTFSRGALFACAAGLIALVALVPTRRQLAGVAVTLGGGVLAAGVIAPLHGVTGMAGSLAHREHQGAVALIVLVVAGLLAAAAQVVLAGRAGDAPLPLGPHRGWLAAALICVGFALAIVVGAGETGTKSPALSGGAGRLVSLRSDRYDYWHVALRAFAHRPLSGVGAGNWVVYWLRWRPIQEFAVDAHSLPLQTLAELGVLGVLALFAFVVGVFLAGRRAMRAGAGWIVNVNVDNPSPAPGAAAAAGPAAALVCYLAHSPLDWDWQMPALTLVAIVLAGALLAEGPPADAASADAASADAPLADAPPG